MFTHDIASQHPTVMIPSKTTAGAQLFSTYLSKIEKIDEDTTTQYPRSGPGSKQAITNDLRKQYNTELQKIEEVTAEELSEANRPQMNVPKTEGGVELKQRYDGHIQKVESGTGDASFIREKVNNLRVEYNEILQKIEGAEEE